MLIIDFKNFPEINTENLLLREVTVNDAEDLFLIRSNEKAMQYIDRPIAKSTNDALDLINIILNCYKNNEAITWAICLKNSPKLIGTIGFWKIDKQNFRAEIGYILHPDYHRNGIMQEAIQAVIKFGFTKINLHSIEANVNPRNEASKNLLLKNGFVQEAYFKENYYYEGKFLDSVIFSLVNKN